MKTSYKIAFISILILLALIMQCNHSFSQQDTEYVMNKGVVKVLVFDNEWHQSFIAANLRDSIGSLFCCDGSRPPCDPTYTIKTYIVGWKLMYIRYERSYDYMTAWIPIYQSEFINLNPIK